MIGPVRTRRRRLPLTPLIDVIFLLLLFFMLSSTFLRFSSVEVTAAGPATGAATASPGRTALLKVRHDGSLSLNGATLAPQEVTPALEVLAAGGTARLLLTAERGASVQHLVRVLETLERGPLPVVLAAGAAGRAP